MTEHSFIETARLILRQWKTEDVAALQRLAGRREIADTMISVPHPFTAEHAESAPVHEDGVGVVAASADDGGLN